MDNFSQLKKQVSSRLFLLISFCTISPIALYYALQLLTDLNEFISLIAALFIVLIASIITTITATKLALGPFKYMWQAILHIAPGEASVPPPNEQSLKVGRELVLSLINQIHQFASQQDSSELIAHRTQLSQAANIVNNLPLPLFVFNKDQTVTSASQQALQYCQIESSQLFGKALYDSVNLEFRDEHTLETWIESCQNNKVTDVSYWERVRVTMPDGSTRRQCDVVASYSRDNPSGTEFIVMLYDKSAEYQEDDSSLSLIAMAVHELRTPLTMMRGYIEVFQTELAPKVDSEMQDFIKKMSLSANQLNAFVSNILNVSRIQENELVLHLQEGHVEPILKNAVEALEYKAVNTNKNITLTVEPNLPSVAIDKISITEVMNNLLENAIKYSGPDQKEIKVAALQKDGRVIVTVQDFGEGIPKSVLPNLFEQFYRNHRTKGKVTGTGLGLYLSRALVKAHGGQIWAESTEGQGSTFGFSLQPYAEVAAKLNKGDNEIIRNANGWIKNHSLYRR